MKQLSKRDEILEVARRQIAQQGYRGTSVREIAEAVGLLAGSIYSHFRSKAEILQEIVGDFYDELISAQRSAFELDKPGAERYAQMVGAVFDVCAQHSEELTILHYDWATLSGLEEMAGVAAQSLETLDLWRAVVDAGREDGSIRDSVDSAVMVRLTTSAIHGLLDTVRYADVPTPKGDLDHQREQLISTLTEGIQG